MKLYTIETGYFKLDGGAMFGVVPKVLWNKTNPADSKNLCSWAMRSLLIEDGNKLILIDNGIGDKQDDKFLKHYYLHGDFSLSKSLKKLGFGFDDITDVFLTHLHFDHCGGSVKWNKDKTDWSDFDILKVNGHTEAQMIPHIKYKDRVIVFAADLLPSIGHIPLPYVMGYDTRPLLTLTEKKDFLDNAVKHNYVIFLQHDYQHECCTLKLTDKGVRLDRTFRLHEIL